MVFSAYFLWFVLACTCLYILITSASSRGTKPQSFKLPPGPRPLPIVGSLFKLGAKPHESLTQLAKIYGPLMSLKLGSITTVVASSAEMAKEILQKNDQALSSRTVVDAARALNHHKSSMVWLPALQKWRNIRKITNSYAFGTQCLEANQDLRNQKVNDLMDYIHECSMLCGGSAAIDIGQLAFTTVLNLMSNIMLSIDLANMNSEPAHDFKAIVRGVMDEVGRPNFADYFPMLRPIDPQGIRRRMSAYFGKLDKIFDEMINRRLQSREAHTSNDLLDRLLNLSLQDKSFEFGRAEIKALLKVNDLMDYIRECSMSSEGSAAIDIGQVAFTTMLNLLSNIMFSVDLANWNSQSAHDFKAIVRGVMDEAGRFNLADYFPMLSRPRDSQGVRRRVSTYFGKLDKIFDEMINRRLQSREVRTSSDLLDSLLNLSQQDKSFEFRLSEIKVLLKDTFVAGTDTTSSTVEWAMAELLKNPKAMEKARKELDDVVTSKDRKIQESDIAQLPYLQAIVKETFRLHPAVPLLVPHKAESDVNICGFVIPKNAQVLVNVWAIGRDLSIWNNSTSFMPERFLGSDIDVKGQDFELIPFGSGRRICPGLPLAHKMVHFMLASLLHRFDWKLEDGMKSEDLDMKERFGLTLQKAEPLRVIPIQAS